MKAKDLQQRSAQESSKQKKNFEKPKNDQGRLDPEPVRQQFFASPFFSWAQFALSVSLHPVQSRNVYPTQRWMAEKKEAFEREMKTEFSKRIIATKERWAADTIASLQSYHYAADTMLELLQIRIADLTQSKESAKATELRQLAEAFQSLLDIKLKFQVLSTKQIGFLQDLAPPSEPPECDRDDGFTISLFGDTPGRVFSSKDIELWMAKYLDNPPPSIAHLKNE